MGARAGDLLAAAATSLRPELPALCAGLTARMIREMPEIAAEQSIEELLSASVAANVATILDVIGAGARAARCGDQRAAARLSTRAGQSAAARHAGDLRDHRGSAAGDRGVVAVV